MTLVQIAVILTICILLIIAIIITVGVHRHNRESFFDNRQENPFYLNDQGQRLVRGHVVDRVQRYGDYMLHPSLRGEQNTMSRMLRANTAGYIGVFNLTNASQLRVHTPGITPHVLKFYYFGSSRSKAEDVRSRNVPIGMSVGYANRLNGTQQCIQNSVNGRSMNASGRFASSDHCIGFRYQSRNSGSRGLTTARVTGWGEDAFDLHVDNHHRDSYVILEAYGDALSKRSGGLRTQSGVVRLQRSGADIETDFVPHSAVFRFLPHFVDKNMDHRTSGSRSRATEDNQDGASVGIWKRIGNVQQSFGNCRHGSSTNLVRHFSSDAHSIAYSYLDSNARLRGRTRARVGNLTDTGIRLDVDELQEPVYVMYTVIGNDEGDRHENTAERVHVGSKLLETTGTVKISGFGGIVPKQGIFDMKAHVTSADENSGSGRNRQDMESVHGNCFGVASKALDMQVAMANSASGSSTNRSAYFAKDNACALMKYVDREARTLRDGKTVVSLKEWGDDYVVLNVESLAGGNPHLLMYAIYGETWNAT